MATLCTKKFTTIDSLRFENERLETFIDWPVEWLNPVDLAQDGFFYLRKADHCACVFCRGIVGVWENGDTPRDEHKRHFPHCPFINDHPVGNIPLAQSQILSRIIPRPMANPAHPFSMDVCGSEECKPYKKTDSVFAAMGLPKHTGPKMKRFLFLESREKSYTAWPSQVKQTPQELAEAGFFYCGLSDHVCCFYCGNGLRNWKKGGNPWEEHAGWYPECNFVLAKKGQDFIDKIRREIPPRPQPGLTSGLDQLDTITEKELDSMMELDIIKATLAMGFPADDVRLALRRKLEQTGQPFFKKEDCIENVLQFMEEKVRTRSAPSFFSASYSSQQFEPAASNTESSSHITPTHSGAIGMAVTRKSSSSPSPDSSSNESFLNTSTSTMPTPLSDVIALPPLSQVAAPTRTSNNDPPDAVMETLTEKTLPVTEKSSVTEKLQSAEDLAAKLEKIELSRMCKVCMDAEVDVVFLPCTHTVTCSSCALALTQCPICRSDIKYVIKPILS